MGNRRRPHRGRSPEGGTGGEPSADHLGGGAILSNHSASGASSWECPGSDSSRPSRRPGSRAGPRRYPGSPPLSHVLASVARGRRRLTEPGSAPGHRPLRRARSRGSPRRGRKSVNHPRFMGLFQPGRGRPGREGGSEEQRTVGEALHPAGRPSSASCERVFGRGRPPSRWFRDPGPGGSNPPTSRRDLRTRKRSPPSPLRPSPSPAFRTRLPAGGRWEGVRPPPFARERGPASGRRPPRIPAPD